MRGRVGEKECVSLCVCVSMCECVYTFLCYPLINAQAESVTLKELLKKGRPLFV